MNCTRCFKEWIPDLENTEQLNLEQIGIKGTLNKLNCANCSICISLKWADENWVNIDGILKKKDKKKENGWEKVTEEDELIKFYILSQIMHNEMEEKSKQKDQILFDFPDETDVIKLLWENETAVGFYTVKRKESAVIDKMEFYSMTTLDTAYIRKSVRGRGFGISLIQDLVETFPFEDIGFSTPISLPMYHVLKKFLKKNPEYKTKFWEIYGVGSQGNRKLVYCTLKKRLLLE